MPRGEKYPVDKTPFFLNIECEDNNVLSFYFTTKVRLRSFERRQRAYRDQVSSVINSRYRGIYLEADELALIDLYSRIETEDRRIEILDVFGVVREIGVGADLKITARIK